MLLLGACDGGDKERPPPVRLSDDAVGHYCGMLLSEHAGPKGQIRLASADEPIWFSSVRDTVAFTRMPLEPKDIRAIYVSDMATAPSWDDPGADNWIAAEDAWFVIGSDRLGGMNAPEPVPFGNEEAARAFATKEGGELVRLAEIPDSYVLGGAEAEPAPPSQDGSAHEAPAHGSHGNGS
jgi:copper chaperone NosL